VLENEAGFFVFEIWSKYIGLDSKNQRVSFSLAFKNKGRHKIIWGHQVTLEISKMCVIHCINSTYHFGGQGLDDIFAEDIPPQLNQILGMSILRRNAGHLCFRVELNQPGLQLAGKMQNLNLISEPASKQMPLQTAFPFHRDSELTV